MRCDGQAVMTNGDCYYGKFYILDGMIRITHTKVEEINRIKKRIVKSFLGIKWTSEEEHWGNVEKKGVHSPIIFPITEVDFIKVER